MRTFLLFLRMFALLAMAPVAKSFCQSIPVSPFLIRKTLDFDLTGADTAWHLAQWHALTKLDEGGEDYPSKFKILYGDRGVYVLFSGAERTISTTYDQDFGQLWNGDVFEVFFHPLNETKGSLSYLEYEINLLGKELVLLLNRTGQKTDTQFPTAYQKKRQVRKVMYKCPALQEKGAADVWMIELFFPFALLQDLGPVPQKGTVWNMNFCRIDYDTGVPKKWSWTPSIRHSFHELNQFFSLVFE